MPKRLSNSKRENVRQMIATANGIELYKKYSEAEAARIIGCHISTLRRMRKKGAIPFVQGGRALWYIGWAIVDFIQFGTKK